MIGSIEYSTPASPSPIMQPVGTSWELRNGPPSTTTDAELWVDEQVWDADVAKAP